MGEAPCPEQVYTSLVWPGLGGLVGAAISLQPFPFCWTGAIEEAQA